MPALYTPVNASPCVAPALDRTEDDRIDAGLMVLVRDRGDHAALADLLPRIAAAIDRPLRRCLPAAEIDDARAEVHLRVWSRRSQYRPECGTVRGWVGRIAMHYAVDWLRKRPVARRLEGIRRVAPPDPAAVAEQADWEGHVLRVCSTYLGRLPPHARTSFELRRQGVGYAQIAAIVGRPVGTVASTVHRVRTKLVALTEGGGQPVSR